MIVPLIAQFFINYLRASLKRTVSKSISSSLHSSCNCGRGRKVTL